MPLTRRARLEGRGDGIQRQGQTNVGMHFGSAYGSFGRCGESAVVQDCCCCLSRFTGNSRWFAYTDAS
jgi:hypothetical protein